MEDQTLKAIDQNVVTAAKFLEDFASDKKKRECLKAYAESTKIVKWIRKETKGNIVCVCVCVCVSVRTFIRVCACVHAHHLHLHFPSPQMLMTCRTLSTSHWPQQLVERMPTHVTSYLI